MRVLFRSPVGKRLRVRVLSDTGDDVENTAEMREWLGARPGIPCRLDARRAALA